MKIWNCKVTLPDDKTICYRPLSGPEVSAQIKLDDLTKRLLVRYHYWIGEDKLCEREDLELLGRLLYSVLFPTGDTSDPKGFERSPRVLFEADYKFFKSNKNLDDRLRLTLELHENARELSRLPWEFIYMPVGDSGFFLAGEKTDLILTRFVPKVPPEINIKTEEPLRILVLFCHPKALKAIDSLLTRELIAEIKQLENLKHIEVRVEENRTHKWLTDLINGDEVKADTARKPEERERFRPDIFHFIGHGEPGALALMRDPEAIQDDQDAGRELMDVDWCNSKSVQELFGKHTPRVVFLHACDGAKPKSIEAFSDLAHSLVYANIPVVIAMQYTIKNKDAAVFAKRFYEYIRKGSPIDEAVRAGREMLGQRQDKRGGWSDRRFGTPVVYLQQDSEKALLEIKDTEDDSREGPDHSPVKCDTNLKVPCPNPTCEGKIFLDSVECVLCDHEVMICPVCAKEGKWNLMSKTIGKCRCGYRLASLRPISASAGDAAQSEKTEARPVAAAPGPSTTPITSASAPPVVTILDGTDNRRRADHPGGG